MTALESVPDHAGNSEPEVAQAVHECAATTLAAFEGERVRDPAAHLRYLPLADSNKRGKPVRMLAHQSSLTNIYARINLYSSCALASTRLVHDEQLQFDNILIDAKSAAEAVGERARAVYTPHSDFWFIETASLVFASSTEGVGLQVAEVLAGFVMRHVRDLMAGRPVDPTNVAAFRSLLVSSDASQGVGLNFVMPTRVVGELHQTHACG